MQKKQLATVEEVGARLDGVEAEPTRRAWPSPISYGQPRSRWRAKMV